MATVTTTKKFMEATGNLAVAYAVKQVNVDFISAYPITPQTIIVEALSQYVADGELKAKFVNVESEHSALSACIGASIAGARVFTATSSQGLALMFEELPVASGLRLPIVMALSMRALSAPINIHNDHSDFMSVRDQGWIMLSAEDAQEIYDLTVMAFKIAEDENVLLPTIVAMDGFTISHTLQRVDVLEDEVVRRFVGERKPKYKLDVDDPITFGPLALTDSYFEFKRQQHEAFKNSEKVIRKVFEEYEKISGRKYEPLKKFMMEDAEVAIVAMGSTVGIARIAAKKLREEGRKAGVVGFTLFRPTPRAEINEVFKDVKTVAVFERHLSLGAVAGPHYMDIISSLEKKDNVKIYDYVYGLGGRDITAKMIVDTVKRTVKKAEKNEPMEVEFVGVRE
jgi:pyruvate ferredoxin oxidoreductase alpha subunit